jgi:hypothetical protein
MNALKKIAAVDPGKVTEFIRHIGRFYGLVAQLENAKINGTCQNRLSANKKSTRLYWTDIDELREKVKMTENVAVSSVASLNSCGVSLGFGKLLDTEGLTNRQIAARVLGFVEALVKSSEYADYMKQA